MVMKSLYSDGSPTKNRKIDLLENVYNCHWFRLMTSLAISMFRNETILTANIRIFKLWKYEWIHAFEMGFWAKLVEFIGIGSITFCFVARKYSNIFGFRTTFFRFIDVWCAVWWKKIISTFSMRFRIFRKWIFAEPTLWIIELLLAAVDRFGDCMLRHIALCTAGDCGWEHVRAIDHPRKSWIFHLTRKSRPDPQTLANFINFKFSTGIFFIIH